MTALDAFLYGMPVVLIAGGLATLYFARRAAAEIASRAPNPRPVVHVSTGARVASFRRPPSGPRGGEAA